MTRKTAKDMHFSKLYREYTPPVMAFLLNWSGVTSPKGRFHPRVSQYVSLYMVLNIYKKEKTLSRIGNHEHVPHVSALPLQALAAAGPVAP